MYLSKTFSARLRALLLAGLLTTAPVASAISREGGFSLTDWIQQLLSSMFTSVTQSDEQCTCGGANPDCSSLHIPGG